MEMVKYMPCIMLKNVLKAKINDLEYTGLNHAQTKPNKQKQNQKKNSVYLMPKLL